MSDNITDLENKISKIVSLSKSQSLGLFDATSLIINQISLSFAYFIIDKVEHKVSNNKIQEIIKFLNIMKFKDIALIECHYYFSRLKKCLEHLLHAPEIVNIINNIRSPVAGSESYEAIRFSTIKMLNENIDVYETRVSVLCSWFTPIRQTVGSCFATAVAIEIQENQPINFFKLIKQAIETNKLSTTYDGVQYSAFIFNSISGINLYSENTVNHNLHIGKIPLIKIIISRLISSKKPEDTDSFIEKFIKETEHIDEIIYKPLSLLLNINEKAKSFVTSDKSQKQNTQYGIRISGVKKDKPAAALIYASSFTCPQILRSWEFCLATFSEVSGRLLEQNIFFSLGWDHQENDGVGSDLIKHLNSRLSQINSDMEFYTYNYNQMIYAQNMAARSRDESRSGGYSAVLKEYEIKIRTAKNTANLVAELYNQMYSCYSNITKNFFIEAYNPAISSYSNKTIEEDSTAGFSLLFKGSGSSFNLVAINDTNTFIKSLQTFFEITEPDIIDMILGDHAEDYLIEEIRNALRTISSTINKESFIYSAFKRIANFREIKINFNNPKEAVEKMMKMHVTPWSTPSGGTPVHLLKNLYNIKNLSTKEVSKVNSLDALISFWVNNIQNIDEKKYKYVLVTSPTHMFRLNTQSIKNIGDLIYSSNIQPDKNINEETLEILYSQIPDAENAIKGSWESTESFRAEAISRLQSSLGSYSAKSIIDSALYSSMPYYKIYTLIDKLDVLMPQELSAYTNLVKDNLYKISSNSTTSSKIIKNIVSILNDKIENIDHIEKFIDNMRTSGFLFDKPKIIGDTNWQEKNLCIVFNPFSKKNEIWSMNNLLLSGSPIFSFEKCLHEGTGTWQVFSNPKEYSIEII